MRRNTGNGSLPLAHSPHVSAPRSDGSTRPYEMPTCRRSTAVARKAIAVAYGSVGGVTRQSGTEARAGAAVAVAATRSEEHTSELQSRGHLVCRLLLEKKNKNNTHKTRA